MAFSLPQAIPAAIGTLQPAPGSPPGPGGSGGAASPGPGAGWEIFVLSASDYSTVLCEIPETVKLSFTFTKQLNDLGSGNVVLSMDDPWWHNTVLSDGNAPEEILDFECVWQIRQDGVPRFEFFGETITEQLVDPTEQRQVTITGPGAISALKWAMCVPHGFPNIILKLDSIQDNFSEVDVNGNGVLDTNLWNATSPSGSVYITPVQGAYPYPGGTKYALSTLYPSGSVTLSATPGTTLLGATPYDASDSVISAQVSPIGLNNASGSYSLAGLDGSELTQFYIQSNANSSYYALIGLSGTAFYCQLGDANGTTTKVMPAYDPAQHAYWMISEQGGTGGGSGTLYFWTSPDGNNWTQRWQAVHSWDARSCSFYFAAAYDVSNSQSAQLTNLNSNVSSPSYQGETYLGFPIMGIWFDQWAKAQARGTIPFTTTSLGPGADSFGNAWVDSQNVQTVNGTDLYSFLQACTSTLNADYVMQPGFVLQVGMPTSTSISLGTQRQGQIVFREGREYQTKQRTRMRSQIQNVIGAENQDGHEISAINSGSVASWGQREAWYQTGAQVDPASMTLAAAAAAAANADQVEGLSAQITPNLPGRTVFQNFDVGDWVGDERPDFSAVDAVRVVAIAVQVDSTGTETHELTFLTYVQWLEQQLTFVTNQLGGSFVNAPGLTPVALSKYGTGQVPTYFRPAQQLNTLADVNMSAGVPATNSPLVFNPVTGQYHPAGSPDPVTGAILPVTVAGSGGTATVTPGGVSVTNATPTVAPDGGGSPGPVTSVATTATGTVTVINGVTRITTGVQGDGTVTVVETNGPAPATPDTPIVTSIPAGITVSWDGLLAAAVPLLDFAYVQVHASATNGFTPSSATLQAVLQTSGTVTISGLTPGTTYYAKLIAVNNSGNASAASTQASVAAGFVSATTISGLTATLIGNIGVLNPNPYFWGGDGSGWAALNGTFAVVTGGLLPAGSPYTYAGQYVSNGTAGSMRESGGPFPAGLNQQYLITAWVYTTGVASGSQMSGSGSLSAGPRRGSGTTQFPFAQLSGSGSLGVKDSQSPGEIPIDIGFNWTNNGTFVSASTATTPVQVGTWTSVTAVLTSPSAGINQAYPRIGSAVGGVTIYAEAILCLPQVPGGLIQTGTITATQIAAGIVVAGIVDATTITGATFNATGPGGTPTGVFVYTPGTTPALGNPPIAALTASDTDLFGNDITPGVASAGGKIIAIGSTPSGGTPSFVQLAPGNPAAVNIGSGAARELIASRVATSLAGSGTTTRISTQIASAETTNTSGQQSFVTVSSATDDNSTGPFIQLQATGPSGSGFFNVFSDFAQVTNVPFLDFRANRVNGVQSSVNGYSRTNPTSAINITDNYTIPAGDATAVGVIYEIEVPFSGVWEASGALNLEFNLDGTFTNLVPIASGLAVAGHNYGGTFRLTLRVTLTGVSGTCDIQGDGGVTDTSVARAGSTSAVLYGINSSHAFDTTVSHTLAVAAAFSVSNGSQTIFGNGSTFTRKG